MGTRTWYSPEIRERAVQMVRKDEREYPSQWAAISASRRERDLPAHVMVYYAIALALYADVSTREVLRGLLEGIRWLGDPTAGREPAGASRRANRRSRRRAPAWAPPRWRRSTAGWSSPWPSPARPAPGIAAGASCVSTAPRSM